MKIFRAFKTELDLNNVQKTACARYAGAARFVYNWGLARKIEARKNGERVPTAFDLSNEITALKKAEFSWMYEISKCVPQKSLRDLDKAFANFFLRAKEKKSGKNIKAGFPRFKSKKNGIGSFRLSGCIHIFDKSIQLPRLGLLRLKEHGYLPTDGVHILSATVSEKAGRWFVSLQVEMEIPDPELNERPVAGVDLGIKRLAQVSNGTRFENPRALKKSLAKIKRLQRGVSRRQPGSENRKKAVLKLAKAHAHVSNIRKDTLHKATTILTKTKSAVVLEDLNVSGMVKNHKLAQAVSDVGMYEFRRQMEYKGKWYGCEIMFADRFYPSTKRCSRCGQVKEVILSEREYTCPCCGQVIDRDLNAAINLEQILDVNKLVRV